MSRKLLKMDRIHTLPDETPDWTEEEEQIWREYQQWATLNTVAGHLQDWHEETGLIIMDWDGFGGCWPDTVMTRTEFDRRVVRCTLRTQPQ